MLTPDINRSMIELRRTVARRGARQRHAGTRVAGSHHVRAVGGAQRRRGARRATARRAGRQRALRQLPRVRRPRTRAGAQQAGCRVADQGGSLRLARPHAPRPARRVRAHHEHHARAPARARPRRDEPVRRGRGGCRRPPASTSASPIPDDRVRQDDALAQREGDARALRVGPPAVRQGGGAAPPGRPVDRRAR